MSVSIQIVYLLSVIGAIGINLHLLSMVLRRPDQIISRYLIVVFSISVSVCTAWLGLSLATSAETALFWTRLRLVIFALAPAIYANTLFYYVGLRRWIRWPRVILLWIIPTVNLLFALFNPRSELYIADWKWARYDVIGVEYIRFGLWQNLGSIYYLSMIFLAIFMLVRRREHTSRLDNLQFAWLMGGIGLAVITNQMRYWGLIGDGQPNPTPIGMFIGGVMVWWGLRLHPISDVARIAHDVIFRSMNEAVIVLNQDDQIVDYNTAAAKHLPLVESAIGHKLDDLPTLGQALRTLEAEHGEIQLGLDNALRHYAVHVANIRDEVRNIQLGKVYTLIDITERKRAEQERERLLVTLNAYARTVAHDLKNPIGVIGGYLDLALEEQSSLPNDGQVLRYLERARHSTDTMTNIVQSLLLLATLRQSEHITLHAIDMNALVQHVITRLEFTAQQRQACFIVAENLSQALGYAHWIEEIWLNFLSNAIKYGGTPPIIIIGMQADTREGYIRYTIHDNGIGISLQDQARLFKDFSRLENHQSVEGHGLGLAIVRQMVERMGGEVMVESAIGQGTTFSFTLPSA